MALTYTPEGQLGTVAPNFELQDTDGRLHKLEEFSHKPLIIMFICNHCPYVKAIEDRLLELGREFKSQAHFFAICSNDSKDHVEDSPAQLKQRVLEKQYPFPYLLDADQSVAKAYGAVCTPDLYLYSKDKRLVYRGRLDDSWRNAKMVQRQELREALKAELAGQSVLAAQNPSMGCSIKWL